MKGLFKGLRYISQIFDNEKEPEIVIGHPTDVKHVAHIGWDGPSANTPSWMNEFKGTPEVSSMSSNGEVKASINSSIQDSLLQDTMEMQKPSGAPPDNPTRHSSSKTKQSKRVNASSNSVDFPTQDPNKPRRNKNSGSLDSPTRESSKRAIQIQNSSNSVDFPTRDPNKPRRHKNSGNLDSPTRESSKLAIQSQNSNLGLDSQSQDPPPPKIPKQSRGRTSKGTSGVGSNRSSRCKGPNPLTENIQCSDPGSEQGLKNNGMCPNSVLEGYEDGKKCDEKSRGIEAL